LCDITPDYILNDNTTLPNPNAMIELGYALQYFEHSNIILLLNKKISKNIVPSLLLGFDLLYYDTDETEYYLDIVEKIKSNVNNYKSDDGWKTFNYQLSKKFITSLQGFIDITLGLIDYTIRINNKINQAVILFPCKRKINIVTKKLILKNKEICLSNYDSLYSELQHLELIIKFNNNS